MESTFIFSLLFIIMFGREYVKLNIYGSSGCQQHDEIVEYFISLDICLVSISSPEGSDKFTRNGTEIIHRRYYDIDDCKNDNMIDISFYPLEDCFSNFTQHHSNDTEIFYFFSLIEFDEILQMDMYNLSNLEDWTTLYYYTDENCVDPIYFTQHPFANSFRKSHGSILAIQREIDVSLEFSVCNETELFQVNYLTSGASEISKLNISSPPDFIKVFHNFPDDQCSDRLKYSLYRRHSDFKSFSKKCRSEEVFYQTEITELADSPKYQTEQLYFTSKCEGTPFSYSQKTLKVCNGVGSIYYNNLTHQLTLGFVDLQCGGEVSTIRFGPDPPRCRPFTDTGFNVQEEWGYMIEVMDDTEFSEQMAIVVVPSCDIYTAEEIELIKRRIVPHEMYYFTEDTCLREEDWAGLIKIGGGKSLRGHCENGKIVAWNYTLRSTCENVKNVVSEDFCVALDHGFASLYFTCIPSYCNSLSQYDSAVCSGNGECVGTDVCECNAQYEGIFCELKIVEDGDEGRNFGPAFFSVLGTSIVVMGGAGTVIIVIISVSCCLILICMGCGLLICLLLCFVILGLYKRQTKFRKLKDFNILLREQEMDQDSSIAHIRIKEELFKIPYQEIELVEKIGSGGSNAVVYRARWKNQVVAFKCFRTGQLCSTQHTFDEFEREVQILGSVNHIHILRFLGCSIEAPRVGILMEYCKKGDLSNFLRVKRNTLEEEGIEGGYPLLEKLRLCYEIILAMDYLHSRNVIHRDLKLENVLIDQNDSCKVMDFGLSKVMNKLDQAQTSKIGTSYYMAPEIVTSSLYTSSVDVFSFAILMYIIFTEKWRPYGDEVMYVEIRVANNPSLRPNLSLLDEKLPCKLLKWMKSTIVQCWNHDPGYRPKFEDLQALFQKYYVEKKEEMEKDEDYLKIKPDEKCMYRSSAKKDLIKFDQLMAGIDEEILEIERQDKDLLLEEIEFLKEKVEELETENRNLRSERLLE